MKRVIAVLVLVVLAGCGGVATDLGTPSTTQTDIQGVTVTEVVDGDTVDVAYPNGTVVRVRLLGIDTPEVHTENAPAEFEGVPDTATGEYCLREAGHDASDYVRSQLLDREVRLVFDGEADRRGSYGRLLAYIYLNDTNVNYRLVAEGYARVYDSEFTQSTRFYDAEREAQQSHRGVWRCADGTDSTTTTTTAPSDLVVTEVHADAAGNDHENLNDEYVVLENTGPEPLALGGWTVSDAAGSTYTFADGFSLGPSESMTLYTGSGEDSATSRYWGADSAIWNNNGDTVIVRNETGVTQVHFDY